MCDGKVIQPADLLLEHVGSNDSQPAQNEAEKQDDQSLDNYMEEIERKMLEEALANARYNKRVQRNCWASVSGRFDIS